MRKRIASPRQRRHPASGASSTVTSIVATLRAAGCVFAEEEAQLLMAAASTPRELAAMVEQPRAGDPLEHVTGWALFCGLESRSTGVCSSRAIGASCWPPSPRLARSPGAVVVDMCCGSGAIGVAIAHAVPGIVLHATDIDPLAIACARRNVRVVERARAPRRPVRRAARGLARSRRRPGRERPLCAHRRHRHAAA